MNRIDISRFEENEIYYNDKVLSILNKRILFQLEHDQFNIYVQSLEKSKRILRSLQTIKVDYQKTGFGYKKFFECPVCKHRRQFLYLNDSLYFVCRKCLGKNVYKDRTSLYDENIENVIKYKIVQQLKLLSNPIAKVSILDLPGSIPEKPRYMRQDRYFLIYARISFLTWMYLEHLAGRRDFTAIEINEMLEKTNTLFAYDTFLFRYFYPEADLILREYEKTGRVMSNEEAFNRIWGHENTKRLEI